MHLLVIIVRISKIGLLSGLHNVFFFYKKKNSDYSSERKNFPVRRVYVLKTHRPAPTAGKKIT